MKAGTLEGILEEVAGAGWWLGCNSQRMPWLLNDQQYRWGVNVTCRGGVIQSRPGRRMRLTLPSGNLQAMTVFTPTKDEATVGQSIVFAVDGKVYYAPFPLTQPASWEPFRLKNVSFEPSARFVYFEVASKSVRERQGSLQFVPNYSVLMMQDGINPAAYWDGELNGQLNENGPNFETPIGTWMKFSGQRLWVARGKTLIASDEGDPLTFKERLAGSTRGDFLFPTDITGLADTIGDNSQSSLIVFERNASSQLKSFILDRTLWASTQDFQRLFYPNIGCVAGRSIINKVGMLWWYADGGLVASDTATSTFLTRLTKFRDMEMANTKRNLAPDLSGICAGDFENYLLMSMPFGDPLNAHTMVLDYASASELGEDISPAWNGVWTGTRPVQWATAVVDGQSHMYQASVDYEVLNGSYNHIWEEFQDDRGHDVFEQFDSNNIPSLVKNNVYSSFETKMLGGGMNIKRFRFAEADLVEIGGDVHLKISYAGTKGGYIPIMNKRIIATIDGEASSNETVQEIASITGPFHVQNRRVTTVDVVPTRQCGTVESNLQENLDRAFGLYFQWCGRMGIEMFRMFLQEYPEQPRGICEKNEEGENIVLQDGTSFHFDD